MGMREHENGYYILKGYVSQRDFPDLSDEGWEQISDFIEERDYHHWEHEIFEMFMEDLRERFPKEPWCNEWLIKED